MYRAATPTLFYRTTAHGVDACDTSTGETRWSWATGVTFVTIDSYPSAMVYEGRVLFLGLLLNPTHHTQFRALVSLDAAYGTVQWVYNAEPIFPASPRQLLLVVAGEAVVLTSCAPNANSAGISIHDGHALWARQEPFIAVPSLAVAGQSAYFDRNGIK